MAALCETCTPSYVISVPVPREEEGGGAVVEEEYDADIREVDGNESLTADGGLKDDIADLEEDAIFEVADGPGIIVV